MIMVISIFEADNPYLFFNSQEHEPIVELGGINHKIKMLAI
tara:strand:+ start:404 stop:526 length:123 start_codon:yes stop_codon:yes gene_type:complete